MKIRSLWLVLVLESFFPSAFAAENVQPSAWDLGLDHLGSSWQDGSDAIGWSILASGIAATIVAHQYDHEVRDSWRDNQKMNRDFSRFGASWGSGGPGLAIAATQVLLDPRHGMAHAESILLTSATHISIAAIAQRGRPSKPESWTSFPSGHTASAWATATSLTYAYGWKVAVPTYAAALVTMGARLSDDKHWLSDTLAAATIGLFWGRATHFHESNPETVSWIPFAAHDGIGLGVKRDF